MSTAEVKSSQGDKYQLIIAFHWLIRLLEDDSIYALQTADCFPIV
jgi:hypothetical protein